MNTTRLIEGVEASLRAKEKREERQWEQRVKAFIARRGLRLEQVEVPLKDVPGYTKALVLWFEISVNGYSSGTVLLWKHGKNGKPITLSITADFDIAGFHALWFALFEALMERSEHPGK